MQMTRTLTILVENLRKCKRNVPVNFRFADVAFKFLQLILDIIMIITLIISQ